MSTAAGFDVVGFPGARHGVLLPVGDRRAAALGLCLLTVSRPGPLLVQRAAHRVVRLLGPRVLPGPRTTWRPPWAEDVWHALREAWKDAVGPVDALAVYRRRQSARDGLTGLLTSRGRAVAVVKVRDEVAGLRVEQHALAQVSAAGTRTFATPTALGWGETDAMGWSLQTAVFTRPHRPVLVLPDGLLDELHEALGGDSHRDLTPWNLRRDHRGRVWLYDWEDRGPAPAGTDAVGFAVAARALTGVALPHGPGSGLTQAGVDVWEARVAGRQDREPANVALRRRTLDALSEARAQLQQPAAPHRAPHTDPHTDPRTDPHTDLEVEST